MDTNKMREQFEAAVMAKWPGIRMLRVNRPGSPVDGEYELPGLEAAWWGWQASRQALVVKLPEESFARGYSEQVAESHGFNDALSYCREAIEAQGLKVTP